MSKPAKIPVAAREEVVAVSRAFGGDLRISHIIRALRRALFGRLGALLLLGLLCLVRVWDPVSVQFVRVKSFDLYQNLKPSTVTERPVVIVDIDDESLAQHGQWPWPRTLLARLTERLAGYGAAAVGFDIVFAEPDRNSPKRYAESMPELPTPVRDALQGLSGTDEKFAAALAATRTVLGVSMLRGTGAPPTAPTPPIAVRAPPGVDAKKHLVGASSLLANIDVLQKAASGVGLINPYPEFDGVIRRVPAIYRVGEKIYTSLAIELIRVATGGSTLVVRAGPDGIENIVFSGPGMPSISVPTDQRGRIWVHSSPHDPKRYVSARHVLDGSLPRDRVEGRLVLVGTSAVGLLDIRATPLTGAMPGVEVHAQLIENILFTDYITRPFYADALEFFTAIVLSLILIFILPRFGATRTMFSGALMIGIVTGAAWILFSNYGLLFDLTLPLGCTLLVFSVLSYFNYLHEEEQKKWVRGAFTRYLAPNIVDELARHPDRLNLGGEIRPMTLMFSDVRGFTEISERFDAAGLTAFMNRYLTPMTDAIMGRGGTVDKYIGDAIMAFWNAPLDDPKHAANACHAALDMLDRLGALNAELAAEAAAANKPYAEIRIGVALNSAECCVGNMGSQQRFDYSVLGDGVNLAARLEGQTKYYGVRTLIGEETRKLAPEFAALEVDLIRVKGKTVPARIYTLLGRPERAGTAEFQALLREQETMLAAYRARDWGAAAAALAKLRAAGDDALQPLCALYERRIAEFRRSPPPPDWDGVYTAETK
jgi:adenylate cyclase